MAERRFYLDRCPGELRGVVTLDGLPERLLIEREGDATPRLGAIHRARVLDYSARLGLARLDLGGGMAGSLRVRGAETPPSVGQAVQAVVVAEPAGGKPAALRRLDHEAEPRPGPNLEARLAELAAGVSVVGGEAAREAADEAQAAALEISHSLAGGLSLTVESTRALTAVDVDLSETGASLSVSQANLQAVAEAARLLRLKALGGLVVIDLIGFPKDRRRLLEAAAEAFAADGPQVVVGLLGLFGTLEVAKPHLEQPLHERLRDPDGALSARTLAQDLVRALERQARAAPGRRLEAVCAPEVAKRLSPLVARLGPIFSVREAPGAARDHTDIVLL